MNRIHYCASLCVLLGSSLAWGSHSRLLPLPEQTQYGMGSVPLRGIAIAFSSDPNEDDRFAAQQLAAYLEKRTGLQISILGGTTNPGKESGAAVRIRTPQGDVCSRHLVLCGNVYLGATAPTLA